MNTKSLCWLTAGCLAAVTFVAAATVPDALQPARSDAPPARNADSFSPYVTKDGGISRPTNYRETFLHLGSWAVATKPDKPVDEMHNVYARPEDIKAYRRDGTVLIKELSSVGSKKAPSGNGYFQGKFTGLEASIKDSKRFKDEPGNWAYFSFGHKYPLKAEVSKNATAACNKCHEDNAKKDDWVFSQDYPVLRAAAPKSK